MTEEFYPITIGGIGKLLYNLVADTLSRTDQIEIALLVPSSSRISEESLRQSLPRSIRVHSFPSDFQLTRDPERGEIYPSSAAVNDTPHHKQSLAILLSLKSLASKGLEFDFIEFPDYLGWGFCTIQEKRLGRFPAASQLAVRLHTTQGILQHFEDHRLGMTALRHAELERKALEDADLIVAHLAPVVDFNARFYGFGAEWRQKVRINSPPVRVEAGRSVKEPSPSSGMRNIVFPTKFTHVKRPDLLVRAAVQLIRQCNLFSGRVILAAYVTDHQYSDHILRLIPPDLADRFELIDSGSEANRERMLAGNIAVIPSAHESFGLAAYEAAAAGAIVVLNGDCVAFGDRTPFVDGKNCFKFDGTVDGLTQALEKALKSFHSLEPIQYQPDLPYYELESAPEPQTAVSKRTGRVSVVITNYNLGEYLPSAVESALASSYPNVEVVIVDDASSSPSDAQLLNRLEQDSKRDNRIKVIRNAVNRGLPGARNLGVRASTGDYVLPLDADDRISASFIELAVKALEHQPNFDVVVPAAGYFTKDRELEEGQFAQYLTFIGNVVSLGLVQNRFAGATCLMRRGLFERHMYNEQLTSYEDWDLYLRLAMAGHRFLVTNSIHYFYRQRPDSMIRQMTSRKHFDLLARMYKELPSLHPGTRLVSVLAPIVELLRGSGTGTDDVVMAELQRELGELRGRLEGRPLRYKLADAINSKFKRVPLIHEVIKAGLGKVGRRHHSQG